MSEKCQICDGPVKNGRCTLCGMPYRNDEVLYHLNENRYDHYRHATPEVRKKMKAQEIPLGDQPKTDANVSSKEEIQARQNAMRQEAMKRINTTRTASTKKVKTEKKKDSSGLVKIIILIVVLLMGFGPMIEDALESLTETVPSFWEETEEDASASIIPWENENGQDVYSVGKYFGQLTVGEELPEGVYRIYTDEGDAEVRIINGDDITDYLIGEGDGDLKLFLKKEMVVEVSEASASQIVQFCCKISK